MNEAPNFDKNHCPHVLFKKRDMPLGFVRFLFSKYFLSLCKDEFTRCKKCGKLLDMPIQYYQLPVRSFYFLFSALITWGTMRAVVSRATPQSFGKPFVTLFVTVCIILGMWFVDKLITALIMYYGRWEVLDFALPDEWLFLTQKAEQVKRNRKNKNAITGLGCGFSVCILTHSVGFTLAYVCVIIIGIFLRYFCPKIKR